MSRGLPGFLRDNAEAFAVAIAMALVIRHYCIEAFRIPTASMTPTLYGDRQLADGTRLHGDRILVDKFVYLRREPRRWEVVVFRYPLNANKNFIKRLAGLPGEWLRLVDGDVWTSTDEGNTWHIQRKPAGTRDQVAFAYYPEPAGPRPGAFGSMRVWHGDGGWTQDPAARIFRVGPHDGPSTLRFDRKVLPFDARDGGVDTGGYTRKPYVGDVHVSCDVEVRHSGKLTVRLREHGNAHRLELGPDGGFAVIVFEGREHVTPLPVHLEAGQRFSLSFANVDNTLVIAFEGDLELDREIEFPEPSDGQPPMPEEDDPRRSPQVESHYGDHEIAFVADGGLEATLRGMRLARDVHYDLHGDPLHVWKIPKDRFFMLGDNTASSKDSRMWRVAEAYRKNGEVIRWEPPEASRDHIRNPEPGRPPGPGDPEVFVEADVNGLTRRFKRSEIERWGPVVDWPYVPRRNLIGRAFAVFFPFYLPPVFHDPSRIDLIR